MNGELEDCFKSVRDSLNAARASYQIWFTLRGHEKAFDEYREEMNDYSYAEFFQATYSAHYKLMFIETGCIFDTDDRTNRLRRLKELLAQNGLDPLVTKLNDQIGPFKSLVSNILTIRSKLIAHKESSIEPEKLYQKHGITPDNIKELLDTLAPLVREVESAINGNSCGSYVCTTYKWEDATYELLDTLRKGRSRHS